MPDPTQPQTPPGWYPDPEAAPGGPQGAQVLRWWDGTRWTEHRSQGQGQAPAGEAKTSGFAIASLVFGILGGPLFGFIFGFVARGQISRSGGTLKGKGLATAGLLLSAAWTAVIALVVVLAVTGAFDDEPDAERFAGDKREVVAVVDKFEDASEDERFTETCQELLTPGFRDAIAKGGGASCEKLLEREVGGKIQEEIEVKRVRVDGDRATVNATEGGDSIRFQMTRTSGDWRISDIE